MTSPNHDITPAEATAILPYVTDGVVVLDQDLVITFVNERAAEQLGRDHRALSGRGIGEVLRASDSADLESTLSQTRREGQVTRVPVSLEPTGASGSALAIPVDGGVALLFPAGTDGEEASVDTGYEAVLDAMADAAWIVDADGGIRFVNETIVGMTDRDRTDLVGRQQHDGLAALSPDGDAIDRLQAGIDEVLAGDDGVRLELVVAAPEGPVALDTQLSPIELDTGERAVMVVARDLSARAAREQRQELLTEQLLVLNRIVRHDIRNDMSVLLGWSEALADHVDAEGEEIVARLIQTSRHVIALTETVRDFVATLESGDRPTLEPTRLDTLLEEELQRRREFYPEATFDVEGELPAVSVAANELLTSVFRNLLNNAVQHHDGDSPTVTVAVETGPEAVTVTVADDGPGIPPDRREDVFGRRDGLDDPASGVGLYLVDRLVSAYGGSIHVEANDPRGAAFVLTLSLAPEDSSARPSKEATDAQ